MIAAAEKGVLTTFTMSVMAIRNMTQYFNAVADALGLPHPPSLTMSEAQLQLSEAMLSYLTESRRMDNRKLLREFGIHLRYPDLASG